MAVSSDLVDNNNDNLLLLAIPLEKWTPLVLVRNDLSNLLSNKNRYTFLGI